MGRSRMVWVALLALAAVVVTVVIIATDDDGPTAPGGRAREEAPEDEPPTLEDHWHTAYGVYVCGSFLPSIDTGRDPMGIHTHGDGLVHVHPFTRSASGRNADVGLFAASTGAALDDRTLRWNDQEWVEGRSTCDGTPGEVVVVTPEGRVTTDVGSVRFRDCSWMTIAFVAPGATVPPPPSAGFETVTDQRDPAACPPA